MSTDPHLSVEALLLWQTGEFSPSEEQVARKHLQRCSECQKRLERLNLLNSEAEWASAHVAKQRMHTRLRQQTENTFKTVCLRWTHGLVIERPWTASTAMIVIAAVLIVSFTDLTPAARADTLLVKAEQHEASTSFQPYGLRIRNGGGLCNLNMQHPGIHQLPVSNESSVCRSVSDQLQVVGWNWSDLLSAHSFAQWRHTLKHKQDAIEKLKDATEISTTTNDGPIHRATLRLRTSDYHPVLARFEFAEPNKQAVEIEVAESPVGMPLPSVATSEPAALPRPMLSARTLNPFDLAEEQIRLTLHHAGMDDDAQLAIERTSDGLQVWGAVPTESVKANLEKQLSEIPHTTASIQTNEESQKLRRPLPWQSWHGSMPPLAADDLDKLFAGNSEGRQTFQNRLDDLTLRLVAQAKTRDGMVALLDKDRENSGAGDLKRATSEIAAHMLADQRQLADALEPLIGPAGQSTRPLRFAEASKVYELVHDITSASREDAPPLDEAKTKLHTLLR